MTEHEDWDGLRAFVSARMARRELLASDIADLYGPKKSTVNNFLAGRANKMSATTRRAFEQSLDLTPKTFDRILEGEDIPLDASTAARGIDLMQLVSLATEKREKVDELRDLLDQIPSHHVDGSQFREEWKALQAFEKGMGGRGAVPDTPEKAMDYFAQLSATETELLDLLFELRPPQSRGATQTTPKTKTVPVTKLEPRADRLR